MSRWKITPWHMMGGAALYAGSAYAFYSHFAGHKLPTQQSAQQADAGPAHGTFDVIAEKYDTAVGSEEWAMGTHHLRKWILNHASGDVLEISAGTGRNLPYYTLSKIKSLTITDLSLPMLERAEDKYYDDLKLGERHPNTRVTFCISDAHCMTADAASTSAAARVYTLPALRKAAEEKQQQGSTAVSGSPTPSADVANVAQQTPEKPGWGGVFKHRPMKPSRSTDSNQQQQQQQRAGQVDTSSTSVTPPSSSHPSNSPSLSHESHHHAQHDAGSRSVWKPWTWFSRRSGPAEAAASCSTCTGCGEDSAVSSGSHLFRCSRGVTESGLPLSKFATASFDTVVDAFGLCSHEDPVQVLREASRVCKPDGKILLLEHGRGHYDWLNARLDASAENHHQKWGCWWNKDIEALIAEAGLEVDKMNRWHFGTTYICIARPATATAQVM